MCTYPQSNYILENRKGPETKKGNRRYLWYYFNCLSQYDGSINHEVEVAKEETQGITHMPAYSAFKLPEGILLSL